MDKRFALVRHCHPYVARPAGMPRGVLPREPPDVDQPQRILRSRTHRGHAGVRRAVDAVGHHHHALVGHECAVGVELHAGEDHHEVQRGVHDVLRTHDPDGRTGHRDREDPERDVLRDHYFLTSAPISSGSGSGTVSIHSPSLRLSCSSLAMFDSEYS